MADAADTHRAAAAVRCLSPSQVDVLIESFGAAWTGLDEDARLDRVRFVEEMGAPARRALVEAALEWTDAKWDGDAARFTLEQLIGAVPKAVLAWAKEHAGAGDIAKADLKLPYREPDGTVNMNAVRAALAVIGGARGGVDLPAAVKADAREELEAILDSINEEKGTEEPAPAAPPDGAAPPKGDSA